MHFDYNDVQEIIEATGKRLVAPAVAQAHDPPPAVRLGEDLRDVAQELTIRRAADKAQSQDERIIEAGKIERHLKGALSPFRASKKDAGTPLDLAEIDTVNPLLFSALSGQMESESFSVERAGREEALLAALERVRLLYHAAKAVRENAVAADPSNFIDRKNGPSAEAWLIGRGLPPIYERHFGGDFKISSRSDERPPDGPAVRFVQVCLEIMGSPKSGHAIQKTWLRHRDISRQKS